MKHDQENTKRQDYAAAKARHRTRKEYIRICRDCGKLITSPERMFWCETCWHAILEKVRRDSGFCDAEAPGGDDTEEKGAGEKTTTLTPLAD